MRLNQIKLNIDIVGKKCDKHGIYAVEGEIPKRTIYAENDGEIAVLQTDGWLRMNLSDIPDFIEELKGIYEDCMFREQEKLKLRASNKQRCKLKVDSGELLDAFKSGMANREISEKLGVSSTYVSQKRFRFKEAGLL